MSNVTSSVRALAAVLLMLSLTLSGCSFSVWTTGPSTPVSSRPTYGVPPSTSTAPPAPGNARFDRPDYAVRFDYPRHLQMRTDVGYDETAGASPDALVALMLDDDNAIMVERRELRYAVTDANLNRVRLESDQVVSQLAGTVVHGTEVEVAGLPGLEYMISLASPPPIRSRYVSMFDGATEYTLNCQSTERHRPEMDAACRTALATLHHR